MPFRQVNVSGFPAVALRSSDVEIVVVPALGAKITNLRRLPGREWLWRSDQIPLAPPIPGASYVETADSGGWDECFPTVGPCLLPENPAVLLPDHGELWSAPWETRVYQLTGGTAFTGTVRGTLLPFEFHREIVVDHQDPVVRFHYQLRHLGGRSFPFLWSAHPLFNVQPATTLTMPSVHSVRVDAAHGRPELRGEEIPWPLDGTGGSFVFPEATEFAMKLFGNIGPSGKAILSDPLKGERLEFVIPQQQVPQIGIWINCHGWSPAGKRPYYNLGLEPCIGAPDRLDDAVERWKMAATLHPGEVREWGFEIWLYGDGE